MGYPGSADSEADVGVLMLTFLVSLATGVAAGLAPALRLARSSVTAGIKEGGDRGGSDASGSRVRSTLVIVEVALSLVLLIGAGLLIRSLWLLTAVTPASIRAACSTASCRCPNDAIPRRRIQARLFEQLAGAGPCIAGRGSAAITTVLPLSGEGNSWPVQIEGRPQLPMAQQPQVQGNLITAAYLRTMRIPIVRGRDFTDADRQGAPAVALVSEAMAPPSLAGRGPDRPAADGCLLSGGGARGGRHRAGRERA